MKGKTCHAYIVILGKGVPSQGWWTHEGRERVCVRAPGQEPDITDIDGPIRRLSTRSCHTEGDFKRPEATKINGENILITFKLVAQHIPMIFNNYMTQRLFSKYDKEFSCIYMIQRHKDKDKE